MGGSQGASGINEMILSACRCWRAAKKLAMAASHRRERF
jgi:UDP-N-acetylglucosamine:LPS N-acetylglucosamine transferase